MATKPLAASSSPGLTGYVSYNPTACIRLDRTSIWQDLIARHRMPNRNPLRRFKIRDMCSRVRNKSADLLENLSLVWEILRGITRYFQAFLCAGIFAHPSQHLLHVSFHFSVAGLCQYPFEACFEEVWVVDDGAELQNCGTLRIPLEGEDSGIRHSVGFVSN